MALIKQALNPDITTTGAGTSPTTTVDNTVLNPVITRIINDNTQAVPVTVVNEAEESVWVDTTDTYFLRRIEYNETTATWDVSFYLADGTVYVPVGAIRPAEAGQDREVVTTHFEVITAGVGYSIGDLVDRVTVYDTVNNTVLSNIYYNLTTSAVVTPVFAHLKTLQPDLSMTNALDVLSYRHASVLAVDTTSATLLTVGASGASHLQCTNNTGAIIEINCGLTNPVMVGMGGSVNMDLNIPAGTTITITPRIIGLGATDYVTINIS